MGQLSVCNSTSHYFSVSRNSCLPCTDCSSNGKETYSNCTANSDSVCYYRCPTGQYFDTQLEICSNCNTCSGKNPKTECTPVSDAVCYDCEDYEFFNTVVGRCTLDCELCPRGCGNHDECVCQMCETGPLCEDKMPDCGNTENTNLAPSDIPTRSDESNESSMNPVTSALIAVGAVGGIIIFSAMFVLLGVATSCRRGNSQTDTSSSNSTDTFLFNGKQSTSLTSLYVTSLSSTPTQEYRTSLDILKHSNGSLNGSWGTPRGSPKSGRSPTSLSCKSRDVIWTPV